MTPPVNQYELQHELHKARSAKLHFACHTGWVDDGDLDNDLNVVVPDRFGTQQYYLAGWRWGWVSHHHSMPVWVANWRENRPGIVYQLTWLDPYMGDSAGHIFPTAEQARAQVESKTFSPHLAEALAAKLIGAEEFR